MAMFVFGLLVNVDSDRRLIQLRKSVSSSEKSGGKRHYKIPRGGFFELISAANYFGEICEWIGFALAAATPGAIFFAVHSTFFLGLRAVSHHK